MTLDSNRATVAPSQCEGHRRIQLSPNLGANPSRLLALTATSARCPSPARGRGSCVCAARFEPFPSPRKTDGISPGTCNTHGWTAPLLPRTVRSAWIRVWCRSHGQGGMPEAFRTGKDIRVTTGYDPANDLGALPKPRRLIPRYLGKDCKNPTGARSGPEVRVGHPSTLEVV